MKSTHPQLPSPSNCRDFKFVGVCFRPGPSPIILAPGFMAIFLPALRGSKTCGSGGTWKSVALLWIFTDIHYRYSIKVEKMSKLEETQACLMRANVWSWPWNMGMGRNREPKKVGPNNPQEDRKVSYHYFLASYVFYLFGRCSTRIATPDPCHFPNSHGLNCCRLIPEFCQNSRTAFPHSANKPSAWI